jgi:energy-coupling factor transport system ATP-binding protein
MSVACRELFKVHRTPEGDAAALQGLSLDAAAGEMLAVLGPSGSGKSTLLRILAGLERPSAGRAVVAGHDLSRLGARARSRVRRRHIGFVGQHAQLALSPVMTVEESLMAPLQIRGVPASVARATARELVERVGLQAGVLRARPHELAGGESQRAALCVAAAHRPAVVLADEPTGELDAQAAAEVLRLLRELADDHGAAVVVVTHDPAGAEAAHRLVRVRDGRVSAEDAGARRAVVIGKGGWLHVPEHILARAGIGDRAVLRAEARAVVLEPLEGPEAIVVPQLQSRPEDEPPAPDRVEGLPVTVVGLHKRYGSRQVFDSFDVDFAAATFTAVMGRSGSGKSTLLRIVSGLELPDEGVVRVGEERLAGQDREQLASLRRRLVAVVPQEVHLASFMTAAEHVALSVSRVGTARHEADSVALSWLTAVGLGDRAGQRVARLSSGERQRVAIARALAGGRRLLVVDEPTSRLDEANAAAVAELLRETADRLGVTVICATHDAVVGDAAHRRLALSVPPGRTRPTETSPSRPPSRTCSTTTA